MTREENMEYIREYIDATDDGTWGSDDDLAEFVMDQLYDEFGDDVVDMVERAMEERRKK